MGVLGLKDLRLGSINFLRVNTFRFLGWNQFKEILGVQVGSFDRKCDYSAI
jgi:hypothetical protein